MSLMNLKQTALVLCACMPMLTFAMPHDGPRMQGEEGGMRCEKMAQMAQKHEQKHAQRVAALKQALKLSAAQEKSFAEFDAQMQALHQSEKPNCEAMNAKKEALQNATTPDRMKAHMDMTDHMHKNMAKRYDIVNKFYATLTPEQQKTFDAMHNGKEHFKLKKMNPAAELRP